MNEVNKSIDYTMMNIVLFCAFEIHSPTCILYFKPICTSFTQTLLVHIAFKTDWETFVTNLNCFYLILKFGFHCYRASSKILLSNFEAKQHRIKFSLGKQCTLFTIRDI